MPTHRVAPTQISRAQLDVAWAIANRGTIVSGRRLRDRSKRNIWTEGHHNSKENGRVGIVIDPIPRLQMGLITTRVTALDLAVHETTRDSRHVHTRPSLRPRHQSVGKLGSYEMLKSFQIYWVGYVHTASNKFPRHWTQVWGRRP